MTTRFKPNLLLYLLAVAALVLLAPYAGVHIATTRPMLPKEEKPVVTVRNPSEAEDSHSSESDVTPQPRTTSRGEGLAEIEQLLGHE